MSDTPRTDEAQFGTGRVSVDFARQLERELAAANDLISQLCESVAIAIESGDWSVDGANDPEAILDACAKHLNGDDNE